MISETLILQGPAGALQAVVEQPDDSATVQAFMVVCHPHPLHGGAMDNKVVTTLAKVAIDCAVPALRFNFRGVGSSQGQFDNGQGEVDDALAVVAYGRQRWPNAKLWLSGFSFGGLVALRTALRLQTQSALGDPADKLVTVAPALTREYSGASRLVAPRCPWLVVQGQTDDIINPEQISALCAQLEPAPQLVRLPDTGHFFHGRLPLLRETVLGFLKPVTGAP